MAVAVEMNFRGATMEQYDQVIQKMGLTPNGATPPGALFHWVAPSDDGIRVVDVWDSQVGYYSYAQEKDRPIQRRGWDHRLPEEGRLTRSTTTSGAASSSSRAPATEGVVGARELPADRGARPNAGGDLDPKDVEG